MDPFWAREEVLSSSNQLKSPNISVHTGSWRNRKIFNTLYTHTEAGWMHSFLIFVHLHISAEHGYSKVFPQTSTSQTLMTSKSQPLLSAQNLLFISSAVLQLSPECNFLQAARRLGSRVSAFICNADYSCLSRECEGETSARWFRFFIICSLFNIYKCSGRFALAESSIVLYITVM